MLESEVGGGIPGRALVGSRWAHATRTRWRHELLAVVGAGSSSDSVICEVQT